MLIFQNNYSSFQNNISFLHFLLCSVIFVKLDFKWLESKFEILHLVNTINAHDTIRREIFRSTLKAFLCKCSTERPQITSGTKNYSCTEIPSQGNLSLYPEKLPKNLSIDYAIISIFLCDVFRQNLLQWAKKTLHNEWSFPFKISSVNVTKSAVFCRFGHLYWRNP